ncbi:MAG: hypothetical protein HY554_00525 [Elusimicrobia bacterium]|nr:hypothetical protein [Elusimicrobiota bacterium]
MRQNAENEGLEGSVVAQRVLGGSNATGLNAVTNEYVDLFKAGIVDPLKVTRSALQNAVSIVGIILATECLVADIPEQNAPAMPAPGGEMY